MILSMAMALLASPSWGYKQEDLDKLAATNKCQECDLAGADLRGTVLTVAVFRDAKIDFADLIINDMIDGKMDLDKKEIAENYLLVGQRGWVSFFPQNGSYTELISTGSLELIRSTNFRRLRPLNIPSP